MHKHPKPSTEDTDQIVCPYCGYEETDSWEIADECKFMCCNQCGKDFELNITLTRSYTTKKCREAANDNN